MYKPASREQILTECLRTQAWVTEKLNEMDLDDEARKRSIDNVVRSLEALKNAQLAVLNLISLLDGRGRVEEETIQCH